jgi:hypothetical protein
MRRRGESGHHQDEGKGKLYVQRHIPLDQDSTGHRLLRQFQRPSDSMHLPYQTRSPCLNLSKRIINSLLPHLDSSFRVMPFFASSKRNFAEASATPGSVRHRPPRAIQGAFSGPFCYTLSYFFKS